MPTLVERQIRTLAHSYLRHGGKQSRRKRVDRLCLACDWITKQFGNCDIRQIGRKQVWAFYDAHANLSDRTLAEYGYAFRLLWELIGRTGEPPFPAKKEPDRTPSGEDDLDKTDGTSPGDTKKGSNNDTNTPLIKISSISAEKTPLLSITNSRFD